VRKHRAPSTEHLAIYFVVHPVNQDGSSSGRRKTIMDNDALKTLVAQGLTAMKAGSEVAAQATTEIREDARHPELKAALETGNKVSQGWAQRIKQALQEVGDASGEAKNPVVEGMYEVSRMIRRQALDDTSRDLGIIANGQIALHYWIAAFGTIRTYASHLGMNEIAHAMQTSLDEAKKGDEAHTAIAQRILSA
jgi:ferritin-like metal-binding protein YciE